MSKQTVISRARREADRHHLSDTVIGEALFLHRDSVLTFGDSEQESRGWFHMAHLQECGPVLVVSG